jgi:transcriptional regulator with XRE-family HTH domain
MKRAEFSTPGKRPPSKRRLHSALAKRLSEFVTSRFSSQREFARALSVDASRITGWLFKSDPEADNLRRIGERTGVSIDWLLGFDVPMYRDQSRSTEELASDVAAHVTRELRALVDRDPDLAKIPARAKARVRAELSIDGAQALRAAVESQRQALVRAWWQAQASTGASEMALNRLFESGRIGADLDMPQATARELRKFLTTSLRDDERLLDAFWMALVRESAR